MAAPKRSTRLDRSRLKGSLKKLAPLLKKLPDDDLYGRPSLSDLIAAVDDLPDTLEGAFADRSEIGPTELGLVMAIADAVGKGPTTKLPKLKSFRTPPQLYLGDLVVSGDFGFGTTPSLSAISSLVACSKTHSNTRA
jgi:hypothetical protein